MMRMIVRNLGLFKTSGVNLYNARGRSTRGDPQRIINQPKFNRINNKPPQSPPQKKIVVEKSVEKLNRNEPHPTSSNSSEILPKEINIVELKQIIENKESSVVLLYEKWDSASRVLMRSISKMSEIKCYRMSQDVAKLLKESDTLPVLLLVHGGKVLDKINASSLSSKDILTVLGQFKLISDGISPNDVDRITREGKEMLDLGFSFVAQNDLTQADKIFKYLLSDVSLYRKPAMIGATIVALRRGEKDPFPGVEFDKNEIGFAQLAALRSVLDNKSPLLKNATDLIRKGDYEKAIEELFVVIKNGEREGRLVLFKLFEFLGDDSLLVKKSKQTFFNKFYC